MTYARNSKSGSDEFFQFIIPKAKVQSGNTITLQAEGDPSTFNMSLKVMKPDDGIMMKLVKYDAVEALDAETEALTADIDHNHILKTASATLLGSVAIATTDSTGKSISNPAIVTGCTVDIPTLSSGTITATVDAENNGITFVTNEAPVGLYTATVNNSSSAIIGVVDIQVNED